jgi:hypothetical protein
MDAETYGWFERAVDRIERLDQTVLTWHGQERVAR